MKEISVYDLKFNPFGLIAKDWALVTAGNKEDYNTLTIAWAEFGSLWNNQNGQNQYLGTPVMSIFIRPQRYTKKFLDEQRYFTVTVYPESYRNKLLYLGSHSGRNEDKIKKVDMDVNFIDQVPYVDGFELMFLCRKLYDDEIKEVNFRNENIREATYPQKDFSTQYIGEVVKVFTSVNGLKKFT